MLRTTPARHPNSDSREFGNLRRLLLGGSSAAALLVVAACGDPSSARIEANPGWQVEQAAAQVSICPSESENRLKSASLRGPHFGLEVECVASMEEFPEDYQIRYLTGDMDLYTPPEGYEYTFIQFSHEPELSAVEDEDSGPVDTVLSVGDFAWEIDGVPEPGSAYMVVGPSSPDVALEVTDTGLSQSLDLNTGERGDTIDALYSGQLTSIETGWTTGDVEATNNEWEVSATYALNFEVTRSVYYDGAWVDDNDQAVLIVAYVWPDSLTTGNIRWDLDPVDALAVSGDGDTLSAEDVNTFEIDDGDASGEGIEQIFYVSGTELEFELEFEIDGEFTIEDENQNISVDDPTSENFSIDFSS